MSNKGKPKFALVSIPNNLNCEKFEKLVLSAGCSSICFGDTLEDFSKTIDACSSPKPKGRVAACKAENCEFEVSVSRSGNPSLSTILGHLNSKHNASSAYKCSNCSLETSSRRYFQTHNNKKHCGKATLEKKIINNAAFIYTWISAAQKCYPEYQDIIIKSVKHLFLGEIEAENKAT